MNTKFIVILLIAGLLSACGNQTTEAPVSLPTEVPATATDIPTETAVPTITETPTEIPTETPPAEPAMISYDANVKPILLSRCVVCHGGSRGTEEGLNMMSYEGLIAGSDNGPVIIPGDAEGSLLIELITKQEMPKRGPKLTPPQVQIITDWVNQGALEN